MEEEPLISILTIVFNEAKYIGQAIDSVLGQTYQRWEWIVLDDGSTDGTGEIIKGIDDRRISYTFQDHAGGYRFTESCNRALSRCKGEFVALLDGDDYWPLDKLEVQVGTFERDDIVLSYGECQLVDPRGRKIGSIGIPEDEAVAFNDPVGSALKLLLDRYCFMAVSTVMVRRSVLTSIGGFIEAEGLFQDFTTWTRLSIEGGFVPVHRLMGYYRKHPASVSLNRKPEELFSFGFDYLRRFISSNEERLRDLSLKYDLNTLEKRWEKLRREFVHYLPYNQALFLLKIGSFREAREQFRKFLAQDGSLKTRLIYCLIVLSAILGYDLASPASSLKEKVTTMFRRDSQMPTA